jgi:retron-type reverse transcriptase
MILEAIYEPLFLDCSHGFRPKRGCHTALDKIKGWNGTKWFVEGDIKGCFDNIDHNRLIEIVGNKVKDKRFTDLIWKFLKAGYMEDRRYNRTHSGTPQGGIISPVLANIYLHELDKFVMDVKTNFDKKGDRRLTPEYRRLGTRMSKLRKRIQPSPTRPQPRRV